MYYMSITASQLTNNWTVCSTACSAEQQGNIGGLHIRSSVGGWQNGNIVESGSMGLLPDTYNRGLRMRRECRERFPRHRLQREPLVSDPGMHHGTCVTDVPWCMSGSLTTVAGKTFPAFPAHAQPGILRIWQEAHGMTPPWPYNQLNVSEDLWRGSQLAKFTVSDTAGWCYRAVICNMI